MKQNTRRSLNRRSFLRISAVLGASAGLAACGGSPSVPAPTAVPAAPTAPPAPTTAPVATPPPPQAATAVPVAVSTFNEAPMLAELVSQGKLPPVDLRLPKNPVVLTGMDGVGKYGGTIRRGFRGFSDRW